ncbi:ribosome silencing factor [Desulfatirhabdium butyrativorans]|uniref:ribosome silencing factor n=1 Tax=Desulfatirhabdium butyrativorans TaxID=340467 RepID=UPI000411D077|nr:ribosome silencing factor [Desulfatirhabdium butyrativorans]
MMMNDPLLSACIRAAQGKKAFDILVMDMRALTSIADYYILCSARSSRQVAAIAEHVLGELRNERFRPIGLEGTTENHWVLIDYGDVVFHIFYEPVRKVYNLEGLWRDAPAERIDDVNGEFEPEGEGDEND